MIHHYIINGLPVETGDLISTNDGGGSILPGEFRRLIGKLIPGNADHIVIYAGPEGRCVEAGAKGRVITLNVFDNIWDADKIYTQGNLIDTLLPYQIFPAPGV